MNMNNMDSGSANSFRLKPTVCDTNRSDGDSIINGGAINLSGATITPSGDTITPSGATITPSSDTITPSSATITPSGDGPTTSMGTITPSGATITPSSDTITPSSDTITPSSDTITPSSATITPSGATITPSGATITPSSATITPSGDGPTTSMGTRPSGSSSNGTSRNLPNQRTNWSHMVLGREALSKGNLIDAMFHFQSEFAHARAEGFPERIAEAATDLAYFSCLTGSRDRAKRLYKLSLSNWKRVNRAAAIRSPRVLSAFALFLYDYANFQTDEGNIHLATQARSRLRVLAKRYTPFTVYSALSNRVRSRGQFLQAMQLLELAREQQNKGEMQSDIQHRLLQNS